MTAPRSVCRNTKKALPTGGRPYMTATAFRSWLFEIRIWNPSASLPATNAMRLRTEARATKQFIFGLAMPRRGLLRFARNDGFNCEFLAV